MNRSNYNAFTSKTNFNNFYPKNNSISINLNINALIRSKNKNISRNNYGIKKFNTLSTPTLKKYNSFSKININYFFPLFIKISIKY